jgi:predicted nucleic acid-binding protein
VSTAGPASPHRTALLDACTLIPIRLTTVLLWLAEAGLFEVLWSDAILEEVERNLPKVGVSSEQAARRVSAMRRGFGAAALVDGFEHLIHDMTCDAKDRHVLAAAVRGGADRLVTFNWKDFPPDSTTAMASRSFTRTCS